MVLFDRRMPRSGMLILRQWQTRDDYKCHAPDATVRTLGDGCLAGLVRQHDAVGQAQGLVQLPRPRRGSRDDAHRAAHGEHGLLAALRLLQAWAAKFREV